MALNNRERVGRAFDYLSEGLMDVVDAVMSRVYSSSNWPVEMARKDAQRYGGSERILTKEDVQVQLRAITEEGRAFKEILSRSQQAWASELRETRNKWAHGEKFSYDDTVRALDTIERLLRAVDAPHSAADVRKMREDLQRTIYEDRTRKQAKQAPVVTLKPSSGMSAWREVIQPHDDVARGEFTASEFAADLHLVHTNQTLSPEYGDPVEFFSRTYLTEGLRDLLTRAVRRLSGDGNASPVVNLQTNFGGGKTHSMLALYHLFSGKKTEEFPQEVQDLIQATNCEKFDSLKVRRVALVGTYLQAGSPSIKEDGTEVCTLWGELAWQLGGREAYEIVASADQAGTNPGEALRTLLQRHTPTIILIDEWVAYARQLLTEKELPAGSFDTQFTFAQTLTEVISSIPGTMLVVSIPASDGGQSSGADIEIGGEKGKRALERLQNVIRRVADQWRPSTRDESFEIVRRRLFQTPDADSLAKIAAVARSFVTLYREYAQAFPREAAATGMEYEKRIRASYPLHPELLDRLYEDWSTLERFQRTRGVLKLVSAIVHELWASNDTSVLILPGNVPLSATSVNTDLTQYLEDSWKPIIDSDIDSSDATASKIDKEKSSLGARHVAQRIARTIFMGAAPRSKSNRKGLDKQYVWLGTAVPGDTIGNFGTALELMSQRSTYFYEDQGHYWFDTQPSVLKTANDHAERLREDEETVWNEIVQRLKSEERKRGVFERVHIAPASSADIPDLEETRLVIVHPRHKHQKQDRDSATLQWVRAGLEAKGGSQRIHRNTLIFLVADAAELESLEASVRSYLGWSFVLRSATELNLSSQQTTQAKQQVDKFNQTVNDRLYSTYVWAVYPEQDDPSQPFTLAVDKVSDSGTQALAERVSKKLSSSEQLITEFASSILGMTVHENLGALWESRDDLSIGELWGYFTRYAYMPRLVKRDVLDNAVAGLVDAVLIDGEKLAIAVAKDPETGRYSGLIVPPDSSSSRLQVTDNTLLVNWEVAKKQQEEDQVAVKPVEIHAADHSETVVISSTGAAEESTRSQVEAAVVRYFGSVKIGQERYSRDINTVSQEIIDRLIGAGATVEITIDIQAIKPEGFNETEVRTIKENAQVLKFERGSGFEKE